MTINSKIFETTENCTYIHFKKIIVTIYVTDNIFYTGKIKFKLTYINNFMILNL